MSSQYSELRPMVNFGLAEICWRVWGTPANFNGFRVFAALLHGTIVAGVSVEQRVPPIFGTAAITLGIGPHSSLVLYLSLIHISEPTRPY